MPNPSRCALYVAAFAIACGVCWDLGSDGATLSSHLGSSSVLALAAIGMGAILVRKVRHEDHLASIDAARCREANAQGWADRVLEEADLLLARIDANPNWRHSDCATMAPHGSTAASEIDLAFLQQSDGAADHCHPRGAIPENALRTPATRGTHPIAARPER